MPRWLADDGETGVSLASKTVSGIGVSVWLLSAAGSAVGPALSVVTTVGATDTEIVSVAVIISVVAVGFGALSVGARVGKIIGVDVGLGVVVAVGEALFSSTHISLNESTGGGLAWSIDPRPHTQPSTAPSRN